MGTCVSFTLGVFVYSAFTACTGEAEFSFPGGGGSIEPSGRTPPSPKKGSIDRTPKILPSLTPRPWRCPRSKNRGKKKMGFLELAR